ncbi:hypothetical protein BTS2_1996 [Bacillus sp. TS-2]|nr:hypothetical protein BTS2_1996 [Bacillus sp. TS-2]
MLCSSLNDCKYYHHFGIVYSFAHKCYFKIELAGVEGKMKTFDKRWLVFLVLIIALASGLSYLALNQETDTAEPAEVQTMSVALVNEDQGAEFNGTPLAFGEAFVQSINRNNNHDWYVVSRGVAESGIQNNTYDMMVVIPNDFSDKALSIDSENPEQVILEYKINASENVRVKEEAEKTASNILNDFNRRIIDVYFASVIGNLQDAQDNISEIIAQQSVYTNTYNESIYQPLAGYTDQFGYIKDNTQLSKDSFGGFEELLESYENQLVENTELDQNYLSSLEDASQLKESNNTNIYSFQDSFNQFYQGLVSGDVERQLQNLQTANSQINEQFQGMQANNQRNSVAFLSTANQERNIVSHAVDLRNHLRSSLQQVEQMQSRVQNILNPEEPDSLSGNIRNRLTAILEDAFENDEQLSINSLFENPDQTVRGRINEQIKQLPSLNPDDFTGYGLPERTVREILNVIAVTEKYNSEFEYIRSENGDPVLGEEINRLVNHLRGNGLSVSDTVRLPKNEKDGQIFTLNIPDKYELRYLGIQLPGHDEGNYTFTYLRNNEILLPTNEKGKMTVNVTLRLKNDQELDDIYKPIKWGWNLKQEDLTNVDEPDEYAYQGVTPLLVSNTTAEQSEDPEDNQEPENENEADNGTEPENGNPVEDVVDEDENGSDPNEDGENGSEGENGQNPSPGKPGNGEGDSDDNNSELPPREDEEQEEEEEEPEPERVVVINNQISHEILSPIENLDNTTRTLINTVANTISSYQQLLSSYESYFGLNMSHHRLLGFLEERTLKQIGEQREDSLYNLFNVKEISGLLTDYITNQIVASITEEIARPLTAFEQQIDQYRQQIVQANDGIDQLAEKISATSQQASVLNESLNQTLEDVARWREETVQLLEAQADIQARADEEQAAMLNLGSEFQPLMMSSQSLADQAQSNLNSAETVYQTFETIDEQADSIQQSGESIVTEAETLSIDLTNKLFEDQAFADNFANVFDNSRIGDRQNENLYDFLSNPVRTSNQGTITSSNAFTPYFLVLICSIVVLFTAYVISTIHQKRLSADQFAAEKSIVGRNTPITLITAGIGILEGIVIGIVSSYYLPISDLNMLQLTMVMVLLVTSMLLLSTYLLRQMKMIGMFILLVVLSMYLFFTDALGVGVRGLSAIERFSPLQYVESLLSDMVQGTASLFAASLILIVLIAIGVFTNLFVLIRSKREEDLGNENRAEAS